jgi:hypothetical protein
MLDGRKMIVALLPWVIPMAAAWTKREEGIIMRRGIPLDERQLLNACQMGVVFPEKIRLMRVDRIPLLNHWVLRAISRHVPSMCCDPVGLSLGYGIYIRSNYWGDSRLIAHECVHAGQYERYGSHRSFLHAYFSQCIIHGYPEAPLEQEAILRSADLRG